MKLLLNTRLTRQKNFCVALSLICIATFSTSLSGQGNTHSQGADYNSRAVDWVQDNGYKALTIIVAVRTLGKEGADSVVQRLNGLGALVEVRFDEIGYIRAVVPTEIARQIAFIREIKDYTVVRTTFNNSPDKTKIEVVGDSVTKTSPFAGISTADILKNNARRDSARLRLLTQEDLEGANPYLPYDEVGLDKFSKQIPEADGRGVTIGIVEGFPDYSHEALQKALTSSGESVPKIRGIIDPSWLPRTITDKKTDLRDSGTLSKIISDNKVANIMTIHSVDGRVIYLNKQIQLPDSGTWSLGSWKPNVSKDSSSYVVAWRDTTQMWVDVNLNNNLMDDTSIPNVNMKFGFGILPGYTSNSGTSFVVAFAPDRTPCVYHPSHFHTTMVAGTAAGSHFLKGQRGGIAPSAQLILITDVSMLEGFILAARDPRIDVITNQSSGAIPYIYVGSSLQDLIFTRMASVYRKPIFISAGNSGPALSTIWSLAASPGVVSVGAYISRRSYAVNDGWHVPDNDNVALFSSRGPVKDGTLKPDLVAPTYTFTASSCKKDEYRTEPSTYDVPRCYMLGGGTSNTAPFAAGAAAVLISAARRNGLPASSYDGQSIIWALKASARSLPNEDVNEQGAGLIQVDSAWRLLQQAKYRFNIITSGPVENVYSPHLSIPGSGPGLFLREGWYPGRQGRRFINLRRTNGPDKPIKYVLRWIGNDGTFSLTDTAFFLSLNKPVHISVDINVISAGLHSAFIDIVDPVHNMILFQIPVTVVSGVPLTSENNFVGVQSANAIWPDNKSTFFDIPRGMDTLRVTVRADSGDLEIAIRDPFSKAYPEVGNGYVRAGETITFILTNPIEGTWEFTIYPPRPNYSWKVADVPTDKRTLSFKVTAVGTPSE